MTQYGKYNPTTTGNNSALFSFQEVPVTSAKLNQWNGNIAASFDLIHRICSFLFAGDSSYILNVEDHSALQVLPVDPPDMRVIVASGLALFQKSIAGIPTAVHLPTVGSFTAPISQPRWDTVILNTSGSLAILNGEENANPVPSALPDDSLPLAHIYHRPGSLQILAMDNGFDSYILDQRPPALYGRAHLHSDDCKPSEVPDGTRTEFSLQDRFTVGSLDVFLNGVLQEKEIDYVENADRRGYNFITPPLSHYSIQHRYQIER